MLYLPKNNSIANQAVFMRLLFLTLLTLFTTAQLMTQDFNADWQNIQKFQQEGKSRSALTAANELYEKAKAAGVKDQQLKALFYRGGFTRELAEDGQEALVDLLRTTIEGESDPTILAVVNYVLGKSYIDYAISYGYRNSGQTEVAAQEDYLSQPLAEWPQERLIRKGADHLLQALEYALAEDVALKDIPAIINEGEGLGYQRPTLFDLLVAEVLNSLNSSYGYITEPTYAFQPGAELLFQTADAFIQAEVATQDTTGHHYRSLRIYQQLLAKHRNFSDRQTTFVTANLNRLQWAQGIVNEPGLYVQRLRAFYQEYAGVANGGIILYQIGKMLEAYPELESEGDETLQRLHLKRALDIYETIVREYPNTQAAQNAQTSIRGIMGTRMYTQTEQTILPEQPFLVNVRYRNLDRLYYRVVPKDFDLNRALSEKVTEKPASLLRKRATYSGQVRLAENDDFKEHSTELGLDGLAYGHYYLLVSGDPSFDTDKSEVSINYLEVSALGCINDRMNNEHIGWIVHRQDGAPVSGATVKVYAYENNYRNRKMELITTLLSDQEGKVKLPSRSDYRQTYLEISKGEDRQVSQVNTYRSNPNYRGSSNYQTYFFLDRGIYRPGQTVYFKGLVTATDDKGRPSLQPNREDIVRLYDANGQEVGTQEVKSDAHGAFHGSFTLPSSSLNGSFSIHANIGGSRPFKVEAYKRPRFEVSFEPNDEPIAAGDSVTVSGKALGFAGPAVTNAKVTYRVVRIEEQYYRYFSRGGNNNEDAVIATGTTTTDDAGNFQVDFIAKLASDAGKARGYFTPYYFFKVYADVADVTGETHSASTRVNLRRKEAQIAINAPQRIDASQQKEVQLTIKYAGAETDDATPVSVQIVPIQHPDPALLNRYWSIPDRPVIPQNEFRRNYPDFAYQKAGDFRAWATKGAAINQQQLQLSGDTTINLPTTGLSAGHYKIDLSYSNTDGAPITISNMLTVMNTDNQALPPGELYHLSEVATPIPAGSSLKIPFVTARNLPQVFNSLHSRELSGPQTKHTITQARTYEHLVTEGDRGGMAFNLHFVYGNRFFQQQRRIQVPWPTKKLNIEYSTFRDKLRPGEAETWNLTIKDHENEAADVQLLASMYDVSLDQFTPHSWQQFFNPWPNYFYFRPNINDVGFNNVAGLTLYRIPAEITGIRNYSAPSLNFGPLYFRGGYGGGVLQDYEGVSYSLESSPPLPSAAPQEEREASSNRAATRPKLRSQAPAGALANTISSDEATSAETDDTKQGADNAPVQIRENLRETAFFYPDLRTDAEGNTVLAFTAPEALTRWKLQLLAHTPDLAYAIDSREVVTQKELMILPNAPRFLREGDRIVFTAKVSNLSDQTMDGTAVLELFDPTTEALIQTYKVAATVPGSNAVAHPFTIGAGESAGVAWEIQVPANSAGLIGYRVIARSGNFSDGEQDALPVLSNRIFLTATKPFFLKPGERKTVTLEALAAAASAGGDLEHKGFSFELTNNPSWLAVKALPYLMEYPYDCTEQLTNRFFANQLSYTIVNSNPSLREVFTSWQADPDALKSPLSLKEDLKQAVLEETPWLREAADESEQQARLAILFDLNRLATELDESLRKLADRQNNDGSFGWFPGGYSNRYMTQYVAESLTRLREIGALNGSRANRAQEITTSTLGYLDAEMLKHYQEIMRLFTKKADRDNYHPSSMIVHYLYVRSAWLEELPFSNEEIQKAWDYFHKQVQTDWTKRGLYRQALLACTFSRTEPAIGRLMIESLRERAIRKAEFGMYWKYERGWTWQRLPIETHCRLLEAFQLNGGTTAEIDDMRLYLLQNKRTNRWETTKATAAGVYALLHSGTDWTADAQSVKVSFPKVANNLYADQLSDAQQTAEAGTGYYQVQWDASEVGPAFAEVKMRNKENTIAWGGMYWQFTQDIDAVEANNDSPLSLKRKLFRRINTAAGERLAEITAAEPMRPGDRLVVQLVVQTDRDMEYVHLKDRRAASQEPTEQLSGYRYNNGLGYYFSPDDLAVHFFIDNLPRGTYTLEYDTFVNHAGDFSNGLSVIQSMYAPEFSAYSEGSRLEVVAQ